jgi:23S rRNA pseudouridine2605 synthase
MRINRYLANAGIGSRRGCEQLVREGRVTVNGAICTNLASQVSADDAVKVDGRLIHAERKVYMLLNKPAGFICTRSDTQDRKTIFALLPRKLPRLFHVGRLDKESEGLLILTNDGELALRLTHPRYKIAKEYEVTLDKPFDMALSAKMKTGFHIEAGHARVECIRRMGPVMLRVELRQGLKRQIREMFFKLGYEVKRLRRTRIGPLTDARLRPGEWRFLSATEISALAPRSQATAAN